MPIVINRIPSQEGLRGDNRVKDKSCVQDPLLGGARGGLSPEKIKVMLYDSVLPRINFTNSVLIKSYI